MTTPRPINLPAESVPPSETPNPTELVGLLHENRQLRIELDALRAELDARAADKFAMRRERIHASARDDLVTSAAVMAFFGYKHRPAFWGFVHAKGVPCIRLNPRRIMFDPLALNQWLAKRDTSARPRQFTFSAEANHALPAA